ncbi:L,D-transpeptidase [Mesorhizobium microcysteis]|uniref:L,D-transpeptidase n=1 Tax=Neoaquamicrobium microcysteis TaxID=2682781 RepID=A0A5D4GSR4_9HYPH|nr:L,D-transpeptidase [Mesorhizobium microcysteis]TYR30315.1 L,D-transpeptidase [Mesorhizobium microcysteis]
MIGRLLSFTAVLFVGLAVEANAQPREVEIFYDQYGRQVLLDPYTGEVVEIREPRGSFRRFEEEPIYRPRYDVEPPRDDFARAHREERMRQLGREPYPSMDPLPRYDDFRRLPEPVYPQDDYGYEDEFAREDPWYRPDQPPVQNDTIERRSLDENDMVAIPDDRQPGSIIEQPPATGSLPDVTQQPEPGRAGATEEIAKIQVLLDRVGASPGVIDGRIGDNVNKAIAAYRELTGETLRTYDQEYVEAQLQATGGDAFQNYEITAVDAAGPFVASIPDDYGEKAQMERMGFVSVTEMLAERFHMDERYLVALNPGVNFDRPGTIIRVANVGKQRTAKVTRIVADKGKRQVRAYGEDGKLVAIYPSTIGSAATPSPTGTHKVERIALDPEYTYNPRINFQQGNNTSVLRIPPGPNGPVGTVWIALSKPTYGIHGTPEPSKIGKTESNGCIRLTNWDAQELAKMVQVGATVEFVE